MAAIFEVKTISQKWQPPFDKSVQERMHEVNENEAFDEMKGNEKTFTLLKIVSGKALVQYHRDFTPKGYEQPKARQFWFDVNESKEFSHLWSEHGITKKLTFKGIGIKVPEIEREIAEEKAEGQTEIIVPKEETQQMKAETIEAVEITESQGASANDS